MVNAMHMHALKSQVTHRHLRLNVWYYLIAGMHVAARSAWAGLAAGVLHTLCGPDHLAVSLHHLCKQALDHAIGRYRPCNCHGMCLCPAVISSCMTVCLQALTPLTIGKSRAVASALGALWGFGHSTGQLILGLIFVALKVRTLHPAACDTAQHRYACGYGAKCHAREQVSTTGYEQCLASNGYVCHDLLSTMVKDANAMHPTPCNDATAHTHLLIDTHVILQERFNDFAPALSKWSGTVVGLTLVAIGVMGVYENYFEAAEQEQHGELNLAMAGGCAADVSVRLNQVACQWCLVLVCKYSMIHPNIAPAHTMASARYSK